jgi:threonyl-tRNA synthetase
VTEKLQLAGIRVEADSRNEKLGYKIREAQLEKIPYMLVVGENEMNAGSLSVRKRGQGDLGVHPLDQVIQMIEEEIRTKQ